MSLHVKEGKNKRLSYAMKVLIHTAITFFTKYEINRCYMYLLNELSV